MDKTKIKLLVSLGISIFVLAKHAEPSPPAVNQDWSAWKYRLPVRLVGLSAAASELLPVDVNFTLKAAECRAPEKEIRLIYRTPDGAEKEVPFQISRLKLWDKGLDPKTGDPTINGLLTFFDVSRADPKGTYFILYGNPDAGPPSYSTDLSVSGDWPAWVIENNKLRVELRKGDPVKPKILHDVFGDSGQIASVTLKSKPEIPITNRDRCFHWNPGILIPERGWSNAHAWDPPELREIEKGPVFVEVRRRGALPLIPEVELAVTYRIFSGRDYVWYGATLRAKGDVGIVSLRSNELVFDEGFITRVVWSREGMTFDRALDELPKANKHGDILRLPAYVPFVAGYNPDKGIGVASINLDYAIVDPLGRYPDRYDHAFFFVKGEGPVGSGGLFFWFRSFFNFSPEWDRRQRFILPAGFTCSEQSLYYFYDTKAAGPAAGVLLLNKAARSLADLDIQVGPYPFGPAK